MNKNVNIITDLGRRKIENGFVKRGLAKYCKL